ncbi:hypothetical protein AB0M68_36685 [Streptomyces sp. NPDC051453]|uniref:hypothetical protein n=1 Tax=Streptomyces sp. NPDC051453 TaxID=3154941 RepID=UPI003446E856
MTRREPDNPYLTDARRRVAPMAPDAAREYAVSVWAYGIRTAEQLSENLTDDLGEWDMVLATLQAVREHLAERTR